MIVVLSQPIQLKLCGLPSHCPSSSKKPPAVGGSVCDDGASVHFGGAGTSCQATVMLAGAPCPFALLATTVYVTTPATGDVAVHVLAVLAQFVQMNDVGPFVHDAASAMLLPA